MSVVITLPDAPPPVGPYVPARLCGNTLYTSGNIGQFKDGTAAEGVYAQTKLALENMEEVLKAAGFSKTDVVKCSAFIANMDDFGEMNKAYAEFFGDHKPCRTCTQAGKLCAPYVFEVDCIAYKK